MARISGILSAEQTAKLLEISTETVARLCRKGYLKAERKSGRWIVVAGEEGQPVFARRWKKPQKKARPAAPPLHPIAAAEIQKTRIELKLDRAIRLLESVGFRLAEIEAELGVKSKLETPSLFGTKFDEAEPSAVGAGA